MDFLAHHPPFGKSVREPYEIKWQIPTETGLAINQGLLSSTNWHLKGEKYHSKGNILLN